MEAILDMSRLAGKNRFDLAALPPHHQLDMHVAADEFLFLIFRERYHTITDRRTAEDGIPAAPAEKSIIEHEKALVQQAARLVHEDYVRQRQLEDKEDAPSVVPFEKLPPEKRNSNIDAAEDIPHKLRRIEHGIRPLPKRKQPQTPDITDEEVEQLAELEHARWCRDQRLQGVIYSEQPVAGKKTSKHLKPYDELEPEIQQYDVQAIYRLPAILRDLGFEFYRMEEAEEFDDGELLEQFARKLHDKYCAERSRRGETSETNSSLVVFEELPDDLRASNYDNAASIPRKLRRLGYKLRRVLPEATPAPLKLSDEQILELGKLEHARWNWQRILQGWSYKAGEKDNENKTTPYLVPWDRLPPEIQEYDLEFVRTIPELVAEAGYEAYPIDERLGW